MSATCFLDLDGVKVDFMAGALAVHGRTLPPREIQYDFWHQLGMSAADFWKPMDRAFWAGLPWHKEGKALLAGLEDLFGPQRVVILTSGGHPEAAAGKREWIEREVPHLAAAALICGGAKAHVAAPGKLLVDDHDPNVTAWRVAGGPAVLVPRPWNSRRDETDDEGGFDVAAVLAEVEAMARPTPTRYRLTHPEILARLPPRADGKGHTREQLRLWVTRGLRASDGSRVRLGAIKRGDQWYTSLTELALFLKLASRFDSGHPSANSP
jgi:hypothetical protein